MQESVRFYTEVLGMESVSPMEPTTPTRGQVVGLRSPGSTQLLELNWYEPGSRFGIGYSNGEDLDHLAFECEDLAGMVAELEKKGIDALIRPKEIGGWNEAFVINSSGTWIELLPRKIQR